MNSAFWLVILILSQAAKPDPVAGVPPDAGIYYRDAAGWAKLQPASMANMKTKGVDMFLETYGLTSLDLTIDYDGARSKAQISSPRPSFYCRAAGSAKDALIIQLTTKKDRRTIRTSSGNATTANKGGFKKDAIRNVTVTEYRDGSFSVAPQQDLRPGEYLLVFGPANTGFDFGIPKQSRR